MSEQLKGTTIVGIKKDGKIAICGDGQVTLGNAILKGNAKKVRRLGKGNVIAGFAGSTADALTLFDRLETMLEKYPNMLTKACVELAKNWRTDKYLRRLEAMMIVADKDTLLVMTGNGDVLSPEHNFIAIGSGSGYATAASAALIDSNMSAAQIAKRAIEIAGDLCIYTNKSITLEEI